MPFFGILGGGKFLVKFNRNEVVSILALKQEKNPRERQLSKGSFLTDSDFLQVNNTPKCGDSQQNDGEMQFRATEHEIKTRFVPKRLTSQLLSESYSRLGGDYLRNAENVARCGTLLEFAHEISQDGSIAANGKLHRANFCRDRLCPMCSWRRSYKIFGQVSKIMDVIGKDYKFLFLTLTVPNVPANLLSSAISDLFKAWDRFNRYKVLKSTVLGYFRALEVTRNADTGEYHPHFHVVLAVSKKYGKTHYIKRDEWLRLWQRACKNYSITQVDIRTVKPKDFGVGTNFDITPAIAEVAKYAVKSAQYIIDGDPALTDKIVSELAPALGARRLAAFGGCFKDVHARLNLDDAEDGDLIHLEDKINPVIAYLIRRYFWGCGVYEFVSQHVDLVPSDSDSGMPSNHLPDGCGSFEELGDLPF